MFRYTTPTLKFELRDLITKELITDLEFDYLLLTLTGDNSTIEKEISYSDVSEGSFKVKLRQEETARLGKIFNAQANIMVGNNRFATKKASGNVECNLHNEVITND